MLRGKTLRMQTLVWSPELAAVIVCANSPLTKKIHNYNYIKQKNMLKILGHLFDDDWEGGDAAF